ncbi:MAG: LptF/LptG family permease [Dokdonella sp.]|nr:LptF/LptG family permease [Dokdonella sp.]
MADLEPGRFVELPGRDGVIYVGEMSGDGTTFKRMFIESEREDASLGKTRIDVVSAAWAALSRRRWRGALIALEDGFRVEGKLGEDDYRLMRFKRNDIKLPDVVTDDDGSARKRAARSSVLWRTPDDPVMRAELHWRLAAPLSVLVLGLLALPLARASPREPRYARLLLALLAWLTYYNLLLLGRSWIATGKLAAGFGLWWVYVPALAIAFALWWSSQRLRAPAGVSP